MQNNNNTQKYEWVVTWVKTVIDDLKIPDMAVYYTEAEALKKQAQLAKRGKAATIEKKEIK